MHRLLRHRPSPALAVSITALVVALGGVAYATIPNSNTGVISGCYATVTSPQTLPGTLRVIDTQSGQTCLPVEKALNWNQRGRTGATGANGATNVVVRSSGFSGAVAPGGLSGEIDAKCNPGEVATGGGGTYADGADGTLMRSFPLPTFGTPNGWAVEYRNDQRTGPVPLTLRAEAFVVCASP
jgi:hypothetical protein